VDEKERLIDEIFIVCKANGVMITGELFISLAFCTESELKKIAHELYIV